jgi:hypothetical protein
LKVIIDSHYAPSIAWWKVAAQAAQVLIEEASFFRKGTYRNRCHIYGANGLLRLSIPLKKGKHQKSTLQTVQISYDHEWQKLHWDSLCSAYRSSPYFEYYEFELKPLYKTNFELLKDFNRTLNEKIKQLIGLNNDWSYTESYLSDYDTDIVDYREVIHPQYNKNGLEEKLNYDDYIQVFSNKFGFLPNLSILDVLFNLGPDTSNYLLDGTPL